MAPSRSPEIAAIVVRVVEAWQERNVETMRNLFSSDASLRVIGFDEDERWFGPDEFLTVFRTQVEEMPDWKEEIASVEAFQEGSVGWASIFGTMSTSQIQTPIRHVVVLRLESGTWQVVQWLNAIPVANERVFGVELTTTLDRLVASVLNDDMALASETSEGTITLVFTDIVDSSVLAETVGDANWAELIADHERAIRRITQSGGGNVMKFLGDGSMLAFHSARAAVRAAVEIQRAAHPGSYAVRVGVHTGEVIKTGGDVRGLTANKAARIAATAGENEILASTTTADMVGSLPGIRIEDYGRVALKGLSGTHPLVAIRWALTD
jgi:adenylate cyclase